MERSRETERRGERKWGAQERAVVLLHVLVSLLLGSSDILPRPRTIQGGRTGERTPLDFIQVPKPEAYFSAQ